MTIAPPNLSREKGWSPLHRTLQGFFSQPNAFVSGDPQGDRFRVAYFVREDDGHLMGKAWFGPMTEGPPGHAHGGSIAALLDEAMGAAAWSAGHPVVAAEITIRFKQMVPIGSTNLIHAYVSSVKGRKVYTRGEVLNKDGQILGEGKGFFLKLQGERFTDMATKARERIERNTPPSSKKE